MFTADTACIAVAVAGIGVAWVQLCSSLFTKYLLVNYQYIMWDVYLQPAVVAWRRASMPNQGVRKRPEGMENPRPSDEGVRNNGCSLDADLEQWA